jgi:hypothetical protein
VSENLRDTTEDRFNRIMREYGPALSRLAFGYEKLAGAREELAQEIALQSGRPCRTSAEIARNAPSYIASLIIGG